MYCIGTKQLTRHQVWYLIESTTLFSGKDPEDGEYKSQKHLAEIVGYIGPPPKGLLERAELGSETFDKDGTSPSPFLSQMKTIH